MLTLQKYFEKLFFACYCTTSISSLSISKLSQSSVVILILYRSYIVFSKYLLRGLSFHGFLIPSIFRFSEALPCFVAACVQNEYLTEGGRQQLRGLNSALLAYYRRHCLMVSCSFIRSFIADIYIAPLQVGLPQHGQIMLF